MERHDPDTHRKHSWRNETDGNETGRRHRTSCLGISDLEAHAALFLAMVWIGSSLRIARLKALWRVGLKLTGLRGPSGKLAAERTEGPRRDGGLRERRGPFGG
ncbi:hypothetical protein [Mesorhizobium sp.]|jgi:hypothetical protein|uniref:hypothetical protein n=1 Tax=Mesorhizobium sp. TaxID=1871066 RepID=UPI003568678A